ncbi:MAG TPA: PAS-domain containing protein [Stellaceae bacterium]
MPARGRAERDRHKLTRRIIGGATVVALAILGLTAATLWRLHEEQLNDGLADLSAINLLVAAQTERAFENVGVMLDGIADDLQAEGIASPATLRQTTGDAAAHRLLQAKMAGVPQLDVLLVATAEGEVVASTRSYPINPPVNVADRDYFLRLRDHPELKHFVSAPLQSRGDGSWTVYVAKRLNAPNGAFAGVVLGAIRLRYFEGLYAEYIDVTAGGNKSIALWRGDGTLLARVPIPADAAAAAANGEAAADLGRPMPKNGLAAFWSVDRQGSRFAVAQRRLDNFPLIVEVRQPAAAILAPWSSESLATALGGGALLVLVGAAVWLLLRQLRAAALVSEERDRANRETEAREDIERTVTKAEAAMRDAQQSEARFRDIVEVSSDWIWETDVEHRFTMIGGAKRPKINLLGKTRWEQPGIDATGEKWRQHKAELDAHQPFRNFRFSIHLPTLGRFDVCVAGKPVFDDDGTFIGYRGTVADETELMEARERAERSDNLLRDALGSISEGFVIYDAEDRFVMCNEAYRKMYGSNAAGFVPGATYEQIMRQALATGRHPDAIGREEEWLAERMRKHREGGEPQESRLSDGRWVMRSERHMPDGGIAGLRIDVTALKTVQTSLRNSQVMLNRAQRVSATGSVWRNFKTGIIEWSDETFRLFGVTREDFTPETAAFLQLVHPEDRPRLAAIVAAGARGEHEPPFQFRVIHPDGVTRTLYRESELWYDTDGTPLERLATYKDITDLAMSKAREHAAQALLRDAIESISEGFVIYDRDDRLVLCNEAYRSLYPENQKMLVPGTRLEDILRAALGNGRYPDAKGREEEWLAERMRHHREIGEALETQLDDGRWVLISERRTSNGGIAGLRIDVTALKRVQQSLRESQQRLDRTQRIAHIGTVERNLHTNAVVWSDETYRIFGVSRDSYAPTTDHLLAVVHPEDQTLLVAAFRRGFNEHINTNIRFRIVRPDGEVRTLFSQADVTYDENNRPLYVSVAMMDITAQEAASQRQIDLETRLRHSEKLTALGTLAGGIAHDLNNILVPIQALSKLVMRELPPNAPAQADLENIHEASIQARDLVAEILAFSRKQEIVYEPTDVGAKVQDALQMLRVRLAPGIELVERLAPVPTILADTGRIQQVVVNLVTNAAQAIGDRGGRITVTVDDVPAAETPGNEHMIRLSVADTGCGMGEEILPRIFEPFFTTKTVGEGTGLGLSVAHGIVISHGGTIDVKSTPDKGTEFVILLPAKPADAALETA